MRRDVGEVELEIAGTRKQTRVVQPSPATHAILTVLKAGEDVFQT